MTSGFLSNENSTAKLSQRNARPNRTTHFNNINKNKTDKKINRQHLTFVFNNSIDFVKYFPEASSIWVGDYLLLGPLASQNFRKVFVFFVLELGFERSNKNEKVK